MSDRHSGYVVTLERDLKDEDSEAVIKAISQLRGVVSVKPVVTDLVQHITEERVRREFAHKLWEWLYPGEQS